MSVTITKTGFRAMEWDGEIRQNVERPIGTFVSELRSGCTIETGVTLGDIFRAVECDRPLMTFIGKYSSCVVAAFHAEAKLPGDAVSDLLRIEISKFIEWDQFEARETLDVSGIGKPEAEFGSTHYAIDFTPVNQLVELPVTINPTVEIRRDHEKIGEAPSCLSLLDVLGEIYFEISFHGSPEDRDSRMAGLRDAVHEIESGAAKLTPWDALCPKDTVQ